MSKRRDDPGQSAGVFVSGCLERVGAGGSDCCERLVAVTSGRAAGTPKCSRIDGARCAIRDGWQRARPVWTLRIDRARVSLHAWLRDVR